MANEVDLTGSIALTKMVCVLMKKNGKDGKPIEGLFIPLDKNYLVKGDAAEDGSIPVYMDIRIKYKPDGDAYKQNGFISKTVNSAIYKKMTDEEKETSKQFTPILGSIKDWSNSNNAAADTGGVASPAVIEEDDDLPF